MSWLIILAKLCVLAWGGRGWGVRSEIRNHSSSSYARSLEKLQWLLLAAGSAQAVQAGVPYTDISLSPVIALLLNSGDGSERCISVFCSELEKVLCVNPTLSQ